MSSYITPEGFARLQAEYDALWREERPRVTREVSEAAALGDRSENAEYIFGKKRLREIDKRLRYLQKRMDELTVVSEPPEERDRVFFGAWVQVCEEDGSEREVRLVGPDESDAARGLISIASPLGRVLLGRREGDEVVWSRPKGRTRLEILSIRYEAEVQAERG